MDYDTCTEEDIVVMDLEGHVVEGSRVPSIEHGLHRAVYAARPEVNAIVHTHPIYSTVFSAMGESIPLLIDEAAQALGDQVRTAPTPCPAPMNWPGPAPKPWARRPTPACCKATGLSVWARI